MVEQSRKDVPDQKASIADPLSFCAITYKKNTAVLLFEERKKWDSIYQEEGDDLTGKATDKDVPSNATMRVITARVRKAT